MRLKQEEKKYVDVETIILLLAIFGITTLFFYLVSVNVPEEPFGLTEITSSLIVGIVGALFMHWTKIISMKNPYLGTILGLLALLLFDYAILAGYRGPYTTTFVIFASLATIFYLGRNFLKGLNLRYPTEDEYD